VHINFWLCRFANNFQFGQKIYSKVSKSSFQHQNYEQTAYLSHLVEYLVEKVENFAFLNQENPGFQHFQHFGCGKG